MSDPRFDAVSELNSVLSIRAEPLLIKIDENSCITAAHYSYESQYDMGILFRHPEGPIDIGVSPPSDIGEDSVEEWAESIDPNLTDGLPGLAIITAMNDEEATELGLRKVDAGGPASGGVPMVNFSGDADTLQEVLTDRNLPYRLVFGLEYLVNSLT